MVNAGLGIAILPHIAFASYPSDNVRCVPLSDPPMDRRMVIATKEGRQPSPAVEKFKEMLRDQHGGLHGDGGAEEGGQAAHAVAALAGAGQ